MEYVIGIALAALVCAFANSSGFDRDRVFYPTLLIVIATYYILFALIGKSTAALAIESVASCIFSLAAVAGFKKSLWLIVFALAGHGVFDFWHSRLIPNPGVPEWWPGFCLAFDVLVGGLLALLLKTRSGFAVRH